MTCEPLPNPTDNPPHPHPPTKISITTNHNHNRNHTQVEMTCEDGARFLLPRGDCAMLPIVHSTAEELAQYLWHRITTVRFFEVCGCGDCGTVDGFAPSSPSPVPLN